MKRDIFADLIHGKITPNDYEYEKNKEWLKPGQRVIGIGEYQRKVVEGLKGTIRIIGISGTLKSLIGVEWDDNIKGHTLDQYDGIKRCKHEHGWFVSVKNIKLLEE